LIRKFSGAFAAFDGLGPIVLGVETGIEIIETLKDGYDTITSLFKSDEGSDDELDEKPLVSLPTATMRVFAV
jgi:hypothetical protein